MTETRTEDGPAIPVGLAIGQVVGQAETVLTKLLAGVLAEALFTLDHETIRLAPRGAELRERIRRGIGDLMAPVWEQLDPADVETTVRTLRRVTTLARDLRPAADGAR